MERLRNIRAEVEKKLKVQYGSIIETIRYSGSYAKGTPISLKYDLDICIYFKNNSFRTLKEMFDNVGSFLRREFPNYNPRKQRVSWGLTLPDNMSLDIVPARSLGDNTGDANLYVSDSGSIIKTNITKHKDYISSSGARPIIKLLKIWKIEHNLHFKSFALELLTIKALDNYNESGFDKRFWKVLNYIVACIDTVKLVDPANSNNIVSDVLSSSDKAAIKFAAQSSLNEKYWENIIW